MNAETSLIEVETGYPNRVVALKDWEEEDAGEKDFLKADMVRLFAQNESFVHSFTFICRRLFGFESS